MSILSVEVSVESINQTYGRAAPLVWLAMALIVFMLVMISLAQVDARLINGVNIWDKPGKFALSLTLHAMTLAWGLGYATPKKLNSKSTRIGVWAFIIAVICEMAWITFQAARGEASHYNTATPFLTMMYSLMGIGATTLTLVTIAFGWKIASSGQSPMHVGIGYGFIVSGVLTTIVAGYMSSQTGHSVGGNLSDATGLPFFHWSTTGGDLRVSHFAALHLAQAMPFFAWLIPDRRIVFMGLIGGTAITLALFVQAILSIPFLAV